MQSRAALVFLLALVACFLAADGCTPLAHTDTGPTSADPANATYAGIYDEPVTLVDGKYEGPPFEEGGASRPRLELVDGLRVDTDLDDDGFSETAVLLTENSGGSGTFLYIALLKKDGAEWRNAGTALVGDRVQVKAFRGEQYKVALEVVQGGPNDAACCPTQNATRRWAFEHGKLEEGGETITGTLSIADISKKGWRLTSINGTELVPESVTITLGILGDSVSGKSGCNEYTATVTEGDRPGVLSFGPVGGTKMLCPEPMMTWEKRFLTALPNLTQYGFVNGELALSGIVDDEYVSFRFREEVL